MYYQYFLLDRLKVLVDTTPLFSNKPTTFYDNLGFTNKTGNTNHISGKKTISSLHQSSDNEKSKETHVFFVVVLFFVSVEKCISQQIHM